MGTSGIPPKLNYRSVKSYRINARRLLRLGEWPKTNTHQDTCISIHIHLYVSTSLSSFNSDILTHIHSFNLTENIRVLHIHTHMNTFHIIITFVELIKYKGFFSLRFLFLSNFSCLLCLYNLRCTIVELTFEVLLFVEHQEILFFHMSLISH